MPAGDANLKTQSHKDGYQVGRSGLRDRGGLSDVSNTPAVKNHLHLGANRQRTSLVHPQNHMAIHPRSGERARESGAFWLFHVTVFMKLCT